LTWPAWHRPGPETTACACHRQAGSPSGLLGPLATTNQTQESSRAEIRPGIILSLIVRIMQLLEIYGIFGMIGIREMLRMT